jgi:formimidoylglutamate deiminase
VAVDACRGIDASAPIHIHVAEQQHEVEACLAWSGARPVEWLLDNTPVDPAWCLVHATHVDDREVARLVSTGAVVGLCPTTEANLGDGVFPLAELNGRRGVWGVGSDAQVSTSPAAELRLLEYGQRLGERRRNVAAGPTHRSTARSLLEAAWAGGAQASGRAVGSLERGARADLVVLDPDHPALAGREADELLDSWIFSGDSTPVRDVMVGGGWVVRDGRHARQDAIAQAYVDVARRIARETPQLAMDLEG